MAFGSIVILTILIIQSMNMGNLSIYVSKKSLDFLNQCLRVFRVKIFHLLLSLLLIIFGGMLL